MILPGKPTKTELNNAVRDNQLVAGHRVQAVGSSVFIRDRQPGMLPTFTVQITDTGPNGEVDYTDNRYWAKILRNYTTTTQGKKGDPLTLLPYLTPEIITVYSPVDYVSGAHLLGIGDVVTVVGEAIDHATTSTGYATAVRWFIVDGQKTLPVEVGSSIGLGVYNGTIITGAATDTTLASMDLTHGEPVLLINGPERGSTDIPLNPPGEAIGLVIGRDTASGKRILLINSASYGLCGVTGSGS